MKNRITGYSYESRDHLCELVDRTKKEVIELGSGFNNPLSADDIARNYSAQFPDNIIDLIIRDKRGDHIALWEYHEGQNITEKELEASLDNPTSVRYELFDRSTQSNVILGTSSDNYTSAKFVAENHSAIFGDHTLDLILYDSDGDVKASWEYFGGVDVTLKKSKRFARRSKDGLS